MKKVVFISLVLIHLCSVFSWGQSGSDDIVISFITINGYSNNLYIDNLLVGTQFDTDLMVASINNIPKDTSYAISTVPYTIAPSVTVTNVGKNDVTSAFDVTMTATGGYASTKSVASITSGQSAEVVFDDLAITPGNEIDITVETFLAGDENPANNILQQYSMIFPGIQRNTVLLEEWTNASCAPCAANNPTIDTFVETNFSALVPIKYHVWWPGQNDPMYQYNIPHNTARTNYYGVGGVPHVIMGGVTTPVYPYTTPGSLTDAYDIQMAKGTPVEITLTDTRIPGDSIRADISVTLHAPLMTGNYYLRVQAIERKDVYATPPGTNGETVFYDVFRMAYPDILGTPFTTTTPGTYNFTFKYAIDTNVWIDSLIYTAVFLQDDVSKEVWASAKGRDLPVSKAITVAAKNTSSPAVKQLPRPGRLNSAGFRPFLTFGEELAGTFNIEMFEVAFPPAGWHLVNPDGGITFEKSPEANGPSFGGAHSVKMDFYSYPQTGETDTLYTRIFTGLETVDSIKFDYAHAEYPGYGPDRLIVMVSADGGQTFPHTIFDKVGNDLATATATTSPFVPSGSEWASFAYPLDMIVALPDSPEGIVTQFDLAQNYPNPFNPVTHIRYSIPNTGRVTLNVYNLLGEKVAELVNKNLQAGNHTVTWNGTDQKRRQVSSGIYFYRLETEQGTLQKKMLYIR